MVIASLHTRQCLWQLFVVAGCLINMQNETEYEFACNLPHPPMLFNDDGENDVVIPCNDTEALQNQTTVSSEQDEKAHIEVLYELKQTLQSHKFGQMVENMEVLIRACHNLMGTPLGPNDLNEDKQSDDVPAKLKTSEGAPPALVMFRDEPATQYSGAYIVGDEVQITCYNVCIMVHLLQLLGVYYIFDLDYPKQYAMFLGVLQQFVLNEPFTRETSKRFKFFCKKLRPAFQKEKDDCKSRTVEN